MARLSSTTATTMVSITSGSARACLAAPGSLVRTSTSDVTVVGVVTSHLGLSQVRLSTPAVLVIVQRFPCRDMSVADPGFW